MLGKTAWATENSSTCALFLFKTSAIPTEFPWTALYVIHLELGLKSVVLLCGLHYRNFTGLNWKTQFFSVVFGPSCSNFPSDHSWWEISALQACWRLICLCPHRHSLCALHWRLLQCGLWTNKLNGSANLPGLYFLAVIRVIFPKRRNIWIVSIQHKWSQLKCTWRKNEAIYRRTVRRFNFCTVGGGFPVWSEKY